LAIAESKLTGMLKSIKIRELFYYSVCFIAFFIPLIPKLLPFLIGFSVISFFISTNVKDSLKKLSKPGIPLLFIGLYIFYLVGLLYSENLKYGWGDVGTKLSLFLFPIILTDSSIYSGNRMRIILKCFIAGCLAVCSLLLARSCYLYFSGNENSFFYESFSYHFHPSYLSLYLNFAIVILITELLPANRLFLLKNILMIVFFILVIFLLSSKTGIICFMLICTVFLFVLAIRNRNIKSYAVFLVLGIGFYFAIKNFGRLNFAAQMLSESKFDPGSTESTVARINIWNASADIIKENLLLGVGTGDVKDELFKSYKHANMTGPLQNKLNAHNQFLQTFIALGLTGFLLLILSFIIPCIYSFRNKNWIYASFLILIVLNLSTESMLERQMGIIFFAFFNSLLYYAAGNKIKNDHHTGN